MERDPSDVREELVRAQMRAEGQGEEQEALAYLRTLDHDVRSVLVWGPAVSQEHFVRLLMIFLRYFEKKAKGRRGY